MILQLCGLSGAGKTSIAKELQRALVAINRPVEIIDADVYRSTVCKDLGYTREDRNENIRRLAFIADRFSNHGFVAVIAAINPYRAIREEVKQAYNKVKTVYLACELDVLIKRDTKQLYKRAFLPDWHPDKLHSLTGVNDPFDFPDDADLVVNTGEESLEQSAGRLFRYVEEVSTRY
ncbi:adenylyl-sulfate kinase [Segetibacter sp. 3557_3]|uniref:adenylyl-sulfate kinase n=1 Tax=Segetibacter sp. 3557_3 TaxID=2547429 RepID=UPI0010584E82|nr:adenylyl-sulfate kinase [Segetibacter sp. 3557_3]TDH18453.1 adenylyl-sulfate kinase [Segetibacter sp. 3557_3]